MVKKKPEVKENEEKAEKKNDEKMAAIVKDLERAVFAIKYYPVATKEEDLEAAKEHIKTMYKKENDTVRQLILYMLHETLAQSAELKTMRNFEMFKRKFPNAEPSQIRMQVYGAMFNYNNSIEGLIEVIKLLGELDGDDAAKVLTSHFSFLSSVEVESAHILRNAIIDALGDSDAPYALRSLIMYARYVDNEKLLQRISLSLKQWNEKMNKLKLPKNEKERLRMEMDKFAIEFGATHYG